MIVVRCGQVPVPPSLAAQPLLECDEIPTRAQLKEVARQATAQRRVAVCGTDAALAAVVTRLMRAEALDVEVAYVAETASPVTALYALPTGAAAAELATSGTAVPTPLLRDDAGIAICGSAQWIGPADSQVEGQVYADSTHVHTGVVASVDIEPTHTDPGLRVATSKKHGLLRKRRWFTARATQYGGPGVIVVRDGLAAARPVPRSSIYRHTEPLLLVRPQD